MAAAEPPRRTLPLLRLSPVRGYGAKPLRAVIDLSSRASWACARCPASALAEMLGARCRRARRTSAALAPGASTTTMRTWTRPHGRSTAACFATMRANEAGTRKPAPIPEFLHEYRVALRRTRGGPLPPARACFPERTVERFKREFKLAGRRHGARSGIVDVQLLEIPSYAQDDLDPRKPASISSPSSSWVDGRGPPRASASWSRRSTPRATQRLMTDVDPVPREAGSRTRTTAPGRSPPRDRGRTRAHLEVSTAASSSAGSPSTSTRRRRRCMTCASTRRSFAT